MVKIIKIFKTNLGNYLKKKRRFIKSKSIYSALAKRIKVFHVYN